MADDTLLNKASTIERCVARIREEYDKDPATFANDFTRQDAAVLNVLRACETCIDIGQILVQRHRLGLPQSSRDVFRLLGKAGFIPPDLASALQRMVGFRNIAVHDYAAVEIPILVQVIEKHLDEFLSFGQIALQQGDNPHTSDLED
jgi:uncharacterized protein YutE (UPF0331/DUF86 family)